MWGILIALVSGALMSIQGVFNTEVTKQTSIWVSAGWVQLAAFDLCCDVDDDRKKPRIWYLAGAALVYADRRDHGGIDHIHGDTQHGKRRTCKSGAAHCGVSDHHCLWH